MGYLPLHVYSGHSILRSGFTLPALIAVAKKNGLSHLGICEYQTMSSFAEFYHLCVESSIQPVFGMDIELDGALLSCFVQSEEGYRHLIALCLAISKKTLTLELIKANQAGLHFVYDGGTGPFYRFIQAKQEKEASEYLASLSKGLDSFSLGLPYFPDRREILFLLREFLAKYPYDFLAYPHIRYEKKEDAIALHILSAIARGENLTEKKATGNEYFLKESELSSYYSMQELYSCESIASSCHFEFLKKRGGLLVYPHEEGLSSAEVLRKQALLGLEKKGKANDPVYLERLDYELGVIDKMGYSDYFLIVSDYVDYALTHGISVGPGRGSAAGSLVAYSLDIVTPDPIEHGLLFERFLNPERQSMPDIDVDFSDIKRNEVVAYVQRRYGIDHVSQIITFQTLGAKASLRDIGRVYGYEATHINRLCNAIVDASLSLRQNYKTNPRFRELIDKDPYDLEIVTLASKIEGLPRQTSIHPVGIVLNDAPLYDAVPVIYSEDVGLICLYEAPYLEEQGFLKMDILSIANLTFVDRCISLIERNHGVHLHYRSIPCDDPEAIELIAKGKTMGLFQIESSGMRKAIFEIKPTTFDDIVAIIALYRPGPMDSIPTYGKRKAGLEKITYLSPLLEKILAPTYGVIVYQEQVLQIVRALAGYSYSQADLFRRAIAKKDALKLDALKEGFLSGCRDNGVPGDVAERVYQAIAKFAGYGFNKSHAIVYATLACQMAYLKAHYPSEFYSAILDGTASDESSFGSLVMEIKQAGLSISLPYINEAGTSFVPKGNSILYPLTAIREIQKGLCHRIVEERDLNGPYQDIFDFASRNKPNGLTVQNLVRFIDAGCFDHIDPRRACLRLAASAALNYAEMVSGSSMQGSLFGLAFPKPVIEEIRENKAENLVLEKEALGIMLSGSPLEFKKDAILAANLKRLSSLPSATGEENYAAIIKGFRRITTKKGDQMAFVTLYDEETEIEAVLFAEAYNRCYGALKNGNIVQARIRKDFRRDGYVVEDIQLL